MYILTHIKFVFEDHGVKISSQRYINHQTENNNLKIF